MAKKLRWGIIGCGMNSHRFAGDMAYAKKCRVEAVGSRTLSKAKDFAEQYGIDKAYGRYEKLMADPDVDAVYIATPHPMHMENTLAALRAGKAVLCEKPLAMNARQVRRMIKTAEKNGLFLMEGMWTRCFPAVRLLLKWLEQERIGEIRGLTAEFGIRFDVGRSHRIFNPRLGGGALLDLGIYVVSFASLVFGQQPQSIQSAVHYARTKVDDQAGMLFQYEGGEIASLACSSRLHMEQCVCIQGSKGMIRVPANFYRPGRIELYAENRRPVIKEMPNPGYGFQFEADHVADCLRKGRRESDWMPLHESLEIMQTMDRIRKGWGLRYPNE